MKMTKRLATLAACAVMAASSMVGMGTNAANTEDDYGNTASEAYTLTSTCYGNINYAGDVDFFVFTPSVSGIYYFYTTGTLYNSSGSTITSATWGFAKDSNMMVASELTAGKKYYIAVNGSYSTTTGRYQLNVGWASLYSRISRLLQSDSRWGDIHLGKNDDNPLISSQGCALTSFTMVTNFWNNQSLTPSDVNDTLMSAAFPFDWETAKSKYDLKLVQKGSSTANTTTAEGISFTKEQLKLGRPVIIGMKYSSGTHFVVACAYYNNEIYIHDPAKSGYTKLSQYINNSYSIYEAFAYYK